MDADEIRTRFTYHPPKPGQPEIYTEIRQRARELVELIVAEAPASRELSLAVTKIEEAVMWANAAIARRSGDKLPKRPNPTPNPPPAPR